MFKIESDTRRLLNRCVRSTQHPRVVVTGLGAVTPLGPDLPTTWRRLIAGEDGAAPVELFDVSGCRCKLGGTAQLPPVSLDRKRASRLSRSSRLAVAAAREAPAQAGLLDADGRSTVGELPISVSTTGGGMALGEQFMRALIAHRKAHNCFLVSRYSAQQQMLDLQEDLGLRGPITIIANACASGANAIGHARDLIRAGAAECVLAGGYESLTELIYVGFDCLQAMSTDRCRPFDTNRSGLMLGEAAAFMVLESETHALRRGARILCELAGYGHSTDLHHLTQPNPRGDALVKAARMAFVDAQLQPGDIGYVNAHGTATLLNDASECAAFSEIFGNGDSTVRISSTKAAIGHTLGAAGSVEAVFAAKTLVAGELPPQINLRQPEPAVAGKLVALGERNDNIRATMSVNLGFGGSNAALIFVRYSEGQTTSLPRRVNSRDGARPSNLAIIGLGAVSPAGLGADALLGKREIVPEAIGAFGSGTPWQVFRVNQKHEQLTRWANEARLRRTSAIALFMLEAAKQALDQAARAGTPASPDKLGIVAAFGTGAVIPTRRFYEGVIKSGPRFASPNIFPETVFNSPTSHIAAVLGVSGPCYSVLGDESAWVNAVGVAATWLANGIVEHALVIGAEEFDPIILDAFAKVRWLRRGGRYVASEGAGALLLRLAQPSDKLRVLAVNEGFPYRNKRGARKAAEEVVEAGRARNGAPADVMKTAQYNWFSGIESELHRAHGFTAPPALPYCGEAFTASAAWNTVRAASLVARAGGRLLQPVWGLNEQCSALLLEAE